MDNKFTLNDSFKTHFASRRKISLIILLILTAFLFLNILLHYKEKSKMENIAIQTFDDANDTLSETYNQIIFGTDYVNPHYIKKAMDTMIKTDFDELNFTTEAMYVFYYDDYSRDVEYLRSIFKHIYVYEIDGNGTKIEVKYE